MWTSLAWLCLSALCVCTSTTDTGGTVSASSFQRHKGSHHHGSHNAMRGQGFDTENEEHGPANQLKNENFIRNAEHIKEHLKGLVDLDLDKVTPQELDFHFYKIQDTNGDNRLDGLELMAAINHGLEDEYEEMEKSELSEERKQSKARLLKNKAWVAVDRILREDDKNNDGYITYDEYAVSRRASKEMRDSIV